ncbi:MAG TPA: hypothetical protein PKH77_14765 [Anaerolineae bacterium]|nr:hypothetical protein [Anaerolineae bacterium]
MADEIVLDLGEYGKILVESAETQTKGGLAPVSRSEKGKLALVAGKLLRMPLTGLGKFFMATLPAPSDKDLYEVDEFTVEFAMGIEGEGSLSIGGEGGVNVGTKATANAEAVAKITPNGAFKCTYTWKRKKAEEEKKQGG